MATPLNICTGAQLHDLDLHAYVSGMNQYTACHLLSISSQLVQSLVPTCTSTSPYPTHLSTAGVLFFWFKPANAGSCTFNVTVITVSILLLLAFSVISIAPMVKGGSLFPSAVISVYCMYLAYGALQSEPHSEVCNGLGHKIDAASGSTLAIGMIIMLFSVIYSAFKCASLLLRCHNIPSSCDQAMFSLP